MTLEQQIESDVSVLLMRALYGKTVVAFGEDGLGKYGRNSLPKIFRIVDMDIDVDDDGKQFTGIVYLNLSDYNMADCGCVATDQNLTISIRELLKADHINPDCLKYAPIERQGDDFVTMYIDVPLLLDWA